MKDLIGISAICLIGGWLYLMTIPTVEETKREQAKDCVGRGQRVTINGKFSGCTKDEPSYRNVYQPKGGPVPMRKIPEYNDDWMDKP